MRTRDRLHAPIDGLPEDDLPAVERFLADRRASDDAFLRALATAPEDDEPLTPEDTAAIQQGLAAIARGDVMTHADVRRSLGLRAESRPGRGRPSKTSDGRAGRQPRACSTRSGVSPRPATETRNPFAIVTGSGEFGSATSG